MEHIDKSHKHEHHQGHYTYAPRFLKNFSSLHTGDKTNKILQVLSKLKDSAEVEFCNDEEDGEYVELQIGSFEFVEDTLDQAVAHAVVSLWDSLYSDDKNKIKDILGKFEDLYEKKEK